MEYAVLAQIKNGKLVCCKKTTTKESPGPLDRRLKSQINKETRGRTVKPVLSDHPLR